MIILLLSALAAITKFTWCLPLVDPGLFVISGVKTCGNGAGYCLLGSDCRLNQDFEADPTGHCSGLKGAFTPSAHFVCCTSPQTKNSVHAPRKPGVRPQGPPKPMASVKPVTKPKPQQPFIPLQSFMKPQQPPFSLPVLPLIKPPVGNLPPVRPIVRPTLPDVNVAATTVRTQQPSTSMPVQPPLVAPPQSTDNMPDEMPQRTPQLPATKPSSVPVPTLPGPSTTPSWTSQQPAQNSQADTGSQQLHSKPLPTAPSQYMTPPSVKPQVAPATVTEKPQLPNSSSKAPESNVDTVATGHQTITSPPDYVQVDSDDSENSIDWEGVKNITEVVVDYCPACDSQAFFSLEGSPLCQGTHLRHGWVITSGACALRIFRSGMIKVVGKYVQDPKLVTQVKTIAVHEDYRPYTSNILHPEPNNIGLVLLSSEPKKTCSPCIPDKEDKFEGKLCSTTSNSTALSLKINKQEKVVSDNVCESILETMQGEGTEDFYTVACDSSSDSRYNVEESVESGKGLMCRGYIAGVETGSGTGLAVFTRVSQYSDWITTNMMQEQRQNFDTMTGF